MLTRCAVALSTLLSLVAAALAVAAPAQADAFTDCPFAAHRGYTAHSVENSLLAFKRAIARHANYLEMDVQATKDGHLALMHDETVDRTSNGHGRVIDKTWAELSRLRLNDGQRIPSLAHVLRAAQSSGVGVLLEMKWIPTSRFDRVYDLVRGFGLSRVVVHSFSPYVAKRFHQEHPDARSGIDVNHEITVADAKSYGGVLPDYRHATDGWLRRLRSAGVSTYLSTLNSEDAWRHYTGRVTLIVTDRAVDYDAYRATACS